MPVNRQHGADVRGIRAWGSLQQEVEPGSAVCEWGCPQNTLTPRLHTLARPQDMGRFQGWPVLQSWASQADTLPFAFPEALSLSRKYPETSEC